MGMFDYVRCDFPLPDDYVMEDDFQTKSLDRNLDRLTITAAGLLTRRPWDEDAGNASKKIIEVVPHNGTINFYGYDRATPQVWHQYRATFDAGRLVSIEKTDS